MGFYRGKLERECVFKIEKVVGSVFVFDLCFFFFFFRLCCCKLGLSYWVLGLSSSLLGWIGKNKKNKL